jgi:hypothetical protein
MSSSYTSSLPLLEVLTVSVRILSYNTVCLIGSPLDQVCSLIFFIMIIKTHGELYGSPLVRAAEVW